MENKIPKSMMLKEEEITRWLSTCTCYECQDCFRRDSEYLREGTPPLYTGAKEKAERKQRVISQVPKSKGYNLADMGAEDDSDEDMEVHEVVWID